MAESTAVTISRLHHVQITIPPGPEAAARAFYCGLLGLPEIDKPESLAGRGGFWVALGDQQVHIGVEEGVDRERTKAHVAYQVDDLQAWRARLTERGIQLAESIPIPGFDRFEFRDPFGNRVEFIQPRREPYLARPSIEFRDSYLEALREYQMEGRELHVDYEWAARSFALFVQSRLDRAKPRQFAPSYVPESEFWLIDNGEYIGTTRIRHRLNDFLRKYGGNIGYQIRPSRRRQGYGRRILQLALVEARRLGLTRALVTCNRENIGSRKIIEANGGVFEGEGPVTIDGAIIHERRYWFDLTSVANGRREEERS